MPELPDLTIYVEALQRRVLGRRVERIEIRSPFLLRTATPPIQAAQGQRVCEVRRLGKRIALGLEGHLWLVIHLMIAGRLHWSDAGERASRRAFLARWHFEGGGTLLLTEAGSKHRASLQLLAGNQALHGQDPGGLEVAAITPARFAERLRRENHTLKRALTDPHLFAGIGNAYSDEILHAARLSPLQMTQRLDERAIAQLYEAARGQLQLWTERLRLRAGEGFPSEVSAFRDGMAVHGRFGLPCPDCGHPVQRIRYAENETNYCAHCQNGGRLLADRALSRLLKDAWPRTL